MWNNGVAEITKPARLQGVLWKNINNGAMWGEPPLPVLSRETLHNKTKIICQTLYNKKIPEEKLSSGNTRNHVSCGVSMPHRTSLLLLFP